MEMAGAGGNLASVKQDIFIALARWSLGLLVGLLGVWAVWKSDLLASLGHFLNVAGRSGFSVLDVESHRKMGNQKTQETVCSL